MRVLHLCFFHQLSCANQTQWNFQMSFSRWKHSLHWNFVILVCKINMLKFEKYTCVFIFTSCSAKLSWMTSCVQFEKTEGKSFGTVKLAHKHYISPSSLQNISPEWLTLCFFKLLFAFFEYRKIAKKEGKGILHFKNTCYVL